MMRLDMSHEEDVYDTKNRRKQLNLLPERSDGVGGSPLLTPTPPLYKKPSISRPGSRASSRQDSRSSHHSRPESVNSQHRTLNRQSSTLSTCSSDFQYEDLPDVRKSVVTTIGRYHTIIPPISHQRPLTAESMYNHNFNNNSGEFGAASYSGDDHAIDTVLEENTPAGTPRLDNPLLSPQYITDTITVLPEEPSEDEERLYLAVKLPSGSTVKRHFRPSDKLMTILQFASAEAQTDLTRSTIMTVKDRRNYTDISQSIKACNIEDRTVLYLKPSEDDG